jgi:hypothetical protein
MQRRVFSSALYDSAKRLHRRLLDFLQREVGENSSLAQPYPNLAAESDLYALRAVRRAVRLLPRLPWYSFGEHTLHYFKNIVLLSLQSPNKLLLSEETENEG